MNGTVSLIANHLDVSVDLPCNINDRVVLRKPLNDELEYLKRILPATVGMGGMLPYEWTVVAEGNGHSGSRCADPKKWKYWVLCDEDSGAATREVERVARLLSPGIELAVTLWRNSLPGSKHLVGHGFAGPQIISRYWTVERAFKLPDRFDSVHIDQLRRLLLATGNLSEKFAFVKDALENFAALSKVDDSSNLKIIGYFAIIESLVTHQPRLTETLDSISHQLRGKLVLLGKRFEHPLESNKYFDDISMENLWKKLYGFRSAIAHGRRPEFIGDYAVLRDIQSVSSFLEHVCKQLLIHGLKEPELINDLRAC